MSGVGILGIASLDGLFLRVFWWFSGVCFWSLLRLCCCLLCSTVTEFLLHSFLCFSVEGYHYFGAVVVPSFLRPIVHLVWYKEVWIYKLFQKTTATNIEEKNFSHRIRYKRRIEPMWEKVHHTITLKRWVSYFDPLALSCFDDSWNLPNRNDSFIIDCTLFWGPINHWGPYTSFIWPETNLSLW